MKKALVSILLVVNIPSAARATLIDSNSITKDGVQYYIQTNKSVYDLGENVEILFRVTNFTDEELVFGYMPPVLDVLVGAREGENVNQVWFWSWDGTWPTGPAVYHLAPDESVELNAVWPQIDLKGTWEIEDDMQVLLGTYGVGGRIGRSGFSDTIGDCAVTVDIGIIPEPATLFLLAMGTLCLQAKYGKKLSS
ncbi:MAG: hypothetical protein ACYS9T_07680 [Planctomycetota bacterium]|jgi:hypothetical protein